MVLVCWRGMHFDEDISLLVIKWAEILKMFGVVYVERTHPNVMKVLRHYLQLDFFILKFIEYPRELPNEDSSLQNLQNELISYNDVLYEHELHIRIFGADGHRRIYHAFARSGSNVERFNYTD